MASAVILVLALAVILLLPAQTAHYVPAIFGVVLAGSGTVLAYFTGKKRRPNTGVALLAIWLHLIGVGLLVYSAGTAALTIVFLYVLAVGLFILLPTTEMQVAIGLSLLIIMVGQAWVSPLWLPSYVQGGLLLIVWITTNMIGIAGSRLMKLATQVEKRIVTLRSKNEQLEKSEKDKTEILSLVSHQLKTPLALIRWSTESVLSNRHLEEKERERLTNVISTTHTMYNTIEDLSHIFKLIMQGSAHYLRYEQINVADLIHEIKTEYAAITDPRQMRIVTKLPKGEVLVRADRVFLKHAIVNLLDNAIKYSPDGSDITISANVDRSQVMISVADHGIGIEPANQERIFERFYRTEKARTMNEHGSGLGLYLVKVIVEKMGGSVTLHSEVGKGSTFSIVVPRG